MSGAILTVPSDKRKLAYACARSLASLNLITKSHELSATKHSLRVALEPYPELLREVEGDVQQTDAMLRATAPARDRQVIRRIMGAPQQVSN